MIRWMLECLEINPHTVFYEKELVHRFPLGLEQANRNRLLEPVEPGRTYSYGLPRPRLVVPREDGVFEAIDEEDLEADPIVLGSADLRRRRLDLRPLALHIQRFNQLSGVPKALDDHIYFLGERRFEGLVLAVVLGFLSNQRSAVATLRGLPNHFATGYDRFVVLCPTFVPDPSIRRELESMTVFVLPLWRDGTVVLDLAELIKGRPERGAPRVVLTDEEEAEFVARAFLSRAAIEVTGMTQKRTGNLLRAAGRKVILGNAPFRIFLRLVLALYQTDSGFVTREELTREHATDGRPGVMVGAFDQAIDRLRAPFVSALDGINARQFIERRQNRVRLSTHPRYVSCERSALLRHEDREIQELAGSLPAGAATASVGPAPE